MKNIISLLMCLLFSVAISAQTKYTIPVVVHIISPTSTPLLTDQEIKDGIKNLNLQFQGLYGKTIKDKVITPHQNSMTAFENIQFKLATRDTNNAVTTGITKTKNATWSNAGIAQEATFKKQKQWNPKRYMNIYIVAALNADKQSGMAYMPSEINTAARAYLDGVLLDDNIWFNTLPLKAPRWTDGFEGTTVHEVAHYLNLIHTMGAINSSGRDCDDPRVIAGDGLDDTPKHWRAAQQFIQELRDNQQFDQVLGIQVMLYGSLAKTGKGHGTDIAVMLGLLGEDPITMDTSHISTFIDHIKTAKILLLDKQKQVRFTPSFDIIFYSDTSLPFHPNGLTFAAELSNCDHVASTFYSIGGGFVVKEGENNTLKPQIKLPFPIDNATDLYNHCIKNAMSISEVVFENEKMWRNPNEIVEDLSRIWHTMRQSIWRGAHTEGVLPGGLNVQRRAARLNKTLLKKDSNTCPNYDTWFQEIKAHKEHFNDVVAWISCFALAVNEENAAFGRVVTAPTNGAAGVIPAVLHYFIAFEGGDSKEKISRFLLTAGEIGSIFKKNATISAAMGGCQAEIGVSSAMAAAALTEGLGGTVKQVLMAAEIAMEHHLGLTCDPVGGLVQIPCIERNTMGAMKAITAASLALHSKPETAKVSLDSVIHTMWQTALDMNVKYKETSDGGLAVNVPISMSEC